MIVSRLNWYLEKYNLNVFSGFRKRRNTVDQLIRLGDDIVKSLGNKSVTLGVFLNLDTPGQRKKKNLKAERQKSKTKRYDVDGSDDDEDPDWVDDHDEVMMNKQ